MASIDASIYDRVQPMQIESPVNALAKVSQVKDMQNRNRLFDMQMADDQAVRAAYQLEDPAARQAALRSASPKAYREELTFQTGQQKAQREAEMAQLDRTRKGVELQGQLLGGVRDQATWEQALQVASQAGMDVSKFPPQYDPAFIKSAQSRALSAQQQLDQQWKALDFDYRKSNDAANRGVTLRGQNLTDARGRESNDINRSLVGQKRELELEKLQDEKRTRDISKKATIDKAVDSLAVIDKALKHPGRETATGKSGVLDPRNYSPGTDATDFQVVLDQLGGQAFLQAFESLKGGGQITEVEGKKATDAMARLNRKQSDAEFKRSLQELRTVVEKGIERAGGTPSQQPNIDSLLDKYK